MTFPRLSRKEAEVLRLLISKGEMYGLELVNNSTELKRGTVYVTLGRMEDKGYVTSMKEDVQPGDGPPRRCYSATGLGQRAYHAYSVAARAFGSWEGAWAV
jgi:PadR family transcriptional regulator, regulatory protein PadR